MVVTSAVNRARRSFAGCLILWLCPLASVEAQQSAMRADSAIQVVSDSIKVRFLDVELRVVVEALGQYLPNPIVVPPLPVVRVTVQTPNAIPRLRTIDLLRGILDGHGFDVKLDSTGIYRVVQRAVVAQRVPNGPGAGIGGANALSVIRLRHARAVDVASTVNALYGRASALGEIGQPRSPTFSQQLQESRIPFAGAASPAVQAPAGGQQLSGSAFSGDVVIVPDEITNSLMIRSSAEDLALVKAAVNELDIRPLQVLIEVLIVEARRDKSLAFGLDALLPSTKVPGSDNTRVSGASQGVGLADFVLRVMGVGGVDLDATLRAAATNGSARIVSRPILLATNNETASILVGSQRPFIQVQRTLPTDAGSRDQVIQYKDVGTELTVRPTVSSDGYVTLQVTQQVNSATAETAFDAPIISTRSIQTKLVVRDSQTIVLGGLSDHQKDVSQGGVPFLSSIPVLGGLFGRRTSHTNETELLLFLTPRIIHSDAEVDSVTTPLKQKAIKKKGR